MIYANIISCIKLRIRIRIRVRIKRRRVGVTKATDEINCQNIIIASKRNRR